MSRPDPKIVDQTVMSRPDPKIVWEKFKKTIQQYNLVKPDDSVLVAVSGGPDSVCLLHLFDRLRRVLLNDVRLYIGYIDHGLRPKDVKKEIRLIKQYANRFKLPVEIEKIKIGKGTKQGIEAAARKLRYKALLKIARFYECNKIATGHNLDDQAETVMLNLLRSRSEEGIIGISHVRALDRKGKIKLIRPLMKIQRKEIINYIKKYNLKYSIDVTNISERFTRNYVRKKILPLLKNINPKICEHLDNLAHRTTQQEEYFNTLLRRIQKSVVIRRTKNKLVLDLLKFLKYNNYLQYKILRYNLINFIQRETYSRLINSIFDILRKPEDKILLEKGIKILKSSNLLVVKRN